MENTINKGTSFRGKIGAVLKGDISTLIALIIMIIMFSLASPYFLTVNNIMSIGSYASIQGTMAAGLTCCMLLGGMDVSQFSTAGLVGMCVGLMYNVGLKIWLIIPIALLVGALVGCINATIIARLKISPMIATMGMQFIVRGFCYIITSGSYVYLNDPAFLFIGSGKLFGFLPFCLVIMVFAYIIIGYLLKYTCFGRNIYACGGNIRAASLAGIDVVAMRYKAHVVSSLCAAIGGIIMASQQTAAMCNAGEGNDMDCIAAVILGGLGLSGGKGKISGTLIGVLIICVLFNGMTLLNVQVYWQKVFKGSVLLLAVFIDSLRSGLLKKA